MTATLRGHLRSHTEQTLPLQGHNEMAAKVKAFRQRDAGLTPPLAPRASSGLRLKLLWGTEPPSPKQLGLQWVTGFEAEGGEGGSQKVLVVPRPPEPLVAPGKSALGPQLAHIKASAASSEVVITGKKRQPESLETAPWCHPFHPVSAVRTQSSTPQRCPLPVKPRKQQRRRSRGSEPNSQDFESPRFLLAAASPLSPSPVQAAGQRPGCSPHREQPGRAPPAPPSPARGLCKHKWGLCSQAQRPRNFSTESLK